MKAKLFITLFLTSAILCFSSAQDRIQFGIRTNLGVFGAKHPNGYELRDENPLRADGYYQYGNIAASMCILTEYTFLKAGDFSMLIQLGIGYDYISFRKKWYFRSGYDSDFTNYSNEQQVIHELTALYLALPLRGSMKFRKLKGSLGVSGSRVVFANSDRTFRYRSGLPLSDWTNEKSQWRAFKDEGAYETANVSYLSHYYGWQGIMSLEYQLKKNIAIGIEFRQFYHSPRLITYLGPGSVRIFNYHGMMWSLSCLFFLDGGRPLR